MSGPSQSTNKNELTNTNQSASTNQLANTASNTASNSNSQLDANTLQQILQNTAQQSNINTGGTQQQGTVGNTSLTSNPWAESLPALRGILNQSTSMLNSTGLTPNENSAFAGLTANASQPNPFTGQVSNLATDLFSGGPDRSGGVTSAFSGLDRRLAPTANGDYLDPNKNPFFSQTQQTIGDDIQKRVNGMFAGAGRDLSGKNQEVLGRSISAGLAPTFASVYNTERGNQMNAANTLYGAGNTTANTLSGLDQTALGNRSAGVGVAGQVPQFQNDPFNRTLAIEAQRRGIPTEQLSNIARITAPLAGLGQTSTGTNTGFNTGANTGFQAGNTTGQASGLNLGNTSTTGANSTTGSTAGASNTSSLANLFGNSNTTGNSQTQSNPGLLGTLSSLFSGGANSPLSGMANAGSSLLPLLALLSDKNEKTDIKKIGTSDITGLDIFSYRYKGDPKTYPKVLGPMAQDIEQKFPGSTETVGGKLYVKPHATGLLGAF